MTADAFVGHGCTVAFGRHVEPGVAMDLGLVDVAWADGEGGG
jgi:hypothetical protein